jgi:hypothetical protein
VKRKKNLFLGKDSSEIENVDPMFPIEKFKKKIEKYSDRTHSVSSETERAAQIGSQLNFISNFDQNIPKTQNHKPTSVELLPSGAALDGFKKDSAPAAKVMLLVDHGLAMLWKGTEVTEAGTQMGKSSSWGHR